MNDPAKALIESITPMRRLVADCEYVAHLIKSNLKDLDTKDSKLLSSVGRMEWDIGPRGEFVSTKKTINVEDRYGKKYKITIEEA
jgi:hypothetical protein